MNIMKALLYEYHMVFMNILSMENDLKTYLNANNDQIQKSMLKIIHKEMVKIQALLFGNVLIKMEIYLMQYKIQLQNKEKNNINIYKKCLKLCNYCYKFR